MGARRRSRGAARAERQPTPAEVQLLLASIDRNLADAASTAISDPKLGTKSAEFRVFCISADLPA